jgi:hypothetical protein
MSPDPLHPDPSDLSKKSYAYGHLLALIGQVVRIEGMSRSLFKRKVCVLSSCLAWLEGFGGHVIGGLSLLWIVNIPSKDHNIWAWKWLATCFRERA